MYVFFLWWVFLVFRLEKRVHQHRAMIHGFMLLYCVAKELQRERFSEMLYKGLLPRNTEDSLRGREVVNDQITITEDICSLH